MTAKKGRASARKALKATVKDLSSKLDRADAKAARLKSEAARLKKARAKLEAEVKELKKRNKRLGKVAGAAGAAGSPKPALGEEPSVVTDGARSDVPPAAADASPAVKHSTTGPDASWTVAQLRAEARSRGLTGLSGKTKAQLLAALR